MPKERPFVVVTGAIRMDTYVSATRTIGIGGPVAKQRFLYRSGDLGLISPAYLKDRKERLGTTGEKSRVLFSEYIPVTTKQLIPEGIEQITEGEKLPIITYHVVTDHFSDERKRDGYLCIYLREREFERIEGETLEQVIKNWLRICEEHPGVQKYSREKAEKQFRNLSVFENLMAGEFNKIVIEMARDIITDEELESLQRYVNTIDECNQRAWEQRHGIFRRNPEDDEFRRTLGFAR